MLNIAILSDAVISYTYGMEKTTLCAQLVQYWDLVPAVVGGIIGALAGGIPAWLLAKRQSDETLRRDREQRTEREKALAFSTSVKLLHITNSTISLYCHVKSCLALRTKPDHEGMEPWQVLIPVVGYTPEDVPKLSAEEMAVFSAAGENDFMQDMMLLAVRHTTSVNTFEEYIKMRNKFASDGPRPTTFEGQIASTFLTPDEVEQYKPYTIPLNCAALGLEANLEKDMKLAKTVATTFGPVCQRYFKDPRFAGLTFPSDDEIAAMISPPDTGG